MSDSLRHIYGPPAWFHHDYKSVNSLGSTTAQMLQAGSHVHYNNLAPAKYKVRYESL